MQPEEKWAAWWEQPFPRPMVKSTLLPKANEKSNALKRILAKKNLIQYERRNVFEAEAADLIKSATRIFEWVSLHLKK